MFAIYRVYLSCNNHTKVFFFYIFLNPKALNSKCKLRAVGNRYYCLQERQRSYRITGVTSMATVVAGPLTLLVTV